MIEPFIELMRSENAILRKNGAVAEAKAREALLEDLQEYLVKMDDTELSVVEAAELAGVHPETVYRHLRKDPNPNRSILRSEIPLLRAKARPKRGLEKKKDSDYPEGSTRLQKAAIDAAR